ncbi:hypothetical protein M9H77_19475 [Catharanthus roseus]|uniref:Uncharacterized protein n=1 Tax=Catharanthus roseus TaxID=4058 RepID=A0ACC0BAI5_CATRO|nr:hypothetical protein M9H77_19475 [Catharanthus roseus]
MQGRNTIEEVLCLSVQRGYTVFYRNCDESNVLNDIVVAHPTSIQMMRTWSYVLIIDTTYNMALLGAIEMALADKNFTVATAFMQNEQGTTYRWVLEQIKQLHFASVVSIGHEEDLNPLAHKFVRVWTSKVLHFGVDTTKPS